MSTETYSVNIHSLEMPIETHFENTLVEIPVEISVETYFTETIIDVLDSTGSRISIVWGNLVLEKHTIYPLWVI